MGMETESELASKAVRKAGESNPKAVDRRTKRRRTSTLSQKKIDELLTSGRALAWTGEHAKVIELVYGL